MQKRRSREIRTREKEREELTCLKKSSYEYTKRITRIYHTLTHVDSIDYLAMNINVLQIPVTFTSYYYAMLHGLRYENQLSELPKLIIKD